MISWPVSTRVGNVKNTDPSLIEPVLNYPLDKRPRSASDKKLIRLAFPFKKKDLSILVVRYINGAV